MATGIPSNEQRECPRCGQHATATANRRGRCTACGAQLVAAPSTTEADVRHHLYGPHVMLAAARERAMGKSSPGRE